MAWDFKIDSSIFPFSQLVVRILWEAICDIGLNGENNGIEIRTGPLEM